MLTSHRSLPIAPAVLIPPFRPREAWTWKLLRCPFCGKKHTHGAGDKGDIAGIRTAHCESPGGSYRIREATAAEIAADRAVPAPERQRAKNTEAAPARQLITVNNHA